MTFFTADICDKYDTAVQVLGPGFANFGGAARCEGRIVTLRLERNNADLVSLLRDEDGRDAQGQGKVVVVDVDQAYYAVVGENLMKFAQRNHYAGIVVNGYIRDTVQIADVPVALFALGTCSRKSIPVTQGERGVMLTFGGVTFKEGDYLYADQDGVIVTKDPCEGEQAPL